MSQVLPDLAALQGVKQSPPHVLDVWEHTLATLEELEKLFKLLVDDSLPGLALDLQMEMVVERLGRYRTHFKTHYARRLNPDRELRQAARQVLTQVRRAGYAAVALRIVLMHWAQTCCFFATPLM